MEGIGKYKRTKEQLNKLSILNSGENNPMFGRKQSEETKNKIGNSLRGKKRKQFTKETRIKMGESHKKEKHWNWKGGITPLKKLIRDSVETKEWRKSCLIRDNFVCQKTRISGGELEVHHINNFADFPELRFEVDNGIVLSKESHKLFHKLYGVKNNTKEQLKEFIENN